MVYSHEQVVQIGPNDDWVSIVEAIDAEDCILKFAGTLASPNTYRSQRQVKLRRPMTIEAEEFGGVVFVAAFRTCGWNKTRFVGANFIAPSWAISVFWIITGLLVLDDIKALGAGDNGNCAFVTTEAPNGLHVRAYNRDIVVDWTGNKGGDSKNVWDIRYGCTLFMASHGGFRVITMANEPGMMLLRMAMSSGYISNSLFKGDGRNKDQQGVYIQRYGDVRINATDADKPVGFADLWVGVTAMHNADVFMDSVGPHEKITIRSCDIGLRSDGGDIQYNSQHVEFPGTRTPRQPSRRKYVLVD